MNRHADADASTIWLMHEPYETTYARCGTYSHPPLLEKADCARCSRGAVYGPVPRPVIVVWEPDSDIVGDFSWPPRCAVVKQAVFDSLAEVFSGIAVEPIEMDQDPKLRRPKRPTKRTTPRVWLPYEGPPLVEMRVECMVPYLPSTTVVAPYHCKDCGRPMTRIGGVEQVRGDWNQQTRKLSPKRTPRVPGQGIFVREADLAGSQIFRIEEFSTMILCTDEVKAFIEERGFTNIEFLEYGNFIR